MSGGLRANVGNQYRARKKSVVAAKDGVSYSVFLGLRISRSGPYILYTHFAHHTGSLLHAGSMKSRVSWDVWIVGRLMRDPDGRIILLRLEPFLAGFRHEDYAAARSVIAEA
jgi:hypothetical protein